MSAAISAAVIGGGAALYSANKSSKAAKSAANTSADAQVRAAQIAAEESRPRYLDFQDPFGNVDWTLDADGRPTGVNVSQSGLTQGLFGDASGIYNNYNNLMKQYFQPNLAAGGSQIYNEWQNLLAPTRQTQQSQLFDALQAKGITGIEGYDPRTGTNANPFANSLFNAWGAQDAQMSSQAINEYLSRLTQLQSGVDTSRGSMVGVAQLPYSNTLNTSQNIATRAANPSGGQMLQTGLAGAANTQAQGQVAGAAYKNSFWNSFAPQVGNALGGLFSGGASNTGGGLMPASPWNPQPYTGATPDYGFSGASLGTTSNLLSNQW